MEKGSKSGRKGGITITKIRKSKRWFYFLSSLLLIAIIYVAIIHTLIMNTANQPAYEDAPYLIVLGAKVNGEEMSLALSNRANTALEYLHHSPNTKVIVTGGKGAGEQISEAEAVRRFLIQHQIDAERILTEEQSTTTYENLLFAQRLMDSSNAKVVIASNDFHLLRALTIAERLGMDASPLAAPTPTVVKLKLYIREYLAFAKSWLFDW